MLTYRGKPIRRIDLAYRAGTGVSDRRYLVETDDKQSRLTTLDRIGSDHGIDEILNVLRRSAGKPLEAKP